MSNFLVDGMCFAEPGTAEIVARRLWDRYDGYRTIQVIENDNGTESVHMTIDATKTPPANDSPEEQQELF